jgi:hypothetical protein
MLSLYDDHMLGGIDFGFTQAYSCDFMALRVPLGH